MNSNSVKWNKWHSPDTSTMSPGTRSRALILWTPLWLRRITLAISGSYSFNASMALSALRSCKFIHEIHISYKALKSVIITITIIIISCLIDSSHFPADRSGNTGSDQWVCDSACAFLDDLGQQISVLSGDESVLIPAYFSCYQWFNVVFLHDGFSLWWQPVLVSTPNFFLIL